MPQSASSASSSKTRMAVAFPSSVCSRYTKPGALSATAFTGSSPATKSASWPASGTPPLSGRVNEQAVEATPPGNELAPFDYRQANAGP